MRSGAHLSADGPPFGQHGMNHVVEGANSLGGTAGGTKPGQQRPRANLEGVPSDGRPGPVGPEPGPIGIGGHLGRVAQPGIPRFEIGRPDIPEFGRVS